ncbi:MAG: TolC family protein [Proteobacteria bacterium]|nr:TolC family protein [Pseudomonadota bacterium]
MTRRTVFLFVLVLPAFAMACSDYSRLNREMAEYCPPVYVAPQVKERDGQDGSPDETALALEKERINEAKALWEKALNTPGSKETFFRPSSGLLNALKPAVTDPAVAAAALVPGFSLETLETLAFLRNPGIGAGENRVRAAMDTYSQVLALDDILRQYTAFTEALMIGIGPAKGAEPMKMKFPFPGVLSLKGEIVGQEIRAVMEDLDIATREAITAARTAYWRLLFVHKAEKIAEETLGLFRHLEEVATIRYETGGTSYQDVIKVRIEREILEEDLDTLMEKQRNWETKILEILNLPPEAKIGLPENRDPVRTVPPLGALYKVATERRQELRRMRARVGKMERLLEMAETMILPPYTLNLSLYEDEAVTQVGSVATKEGFPVSTEASTGFGLPKMPWYGVEDAYLRQTQQELNALRRDLEKEEASTITLVRNAWFRLDLANREESLYRNTILKLSRDALDVSTQGYEAGNVSFADVISSYNSWLSVNLAAEQKMSDLGIARAQLENVVGALLHQERKEGAK